MEIFNEKIFILEMPKCSMGQTIDSLARAELRQKIEEAELHLKETINTKILPLLEELPALLEETRRYCQEEREKIYRKYPEWRYDRKK